MSYTAVLDNGDSEDVGTVAGWPAWRRKVEAADGVLELKRLVTSGHSAELGLLLKDVLAMPGDDTVSAITRLLRRRGDAVSLTVSDGIGEDGDQSLEFSYNPEQARDEAGRFAGDLGIAHMTHSVKLPKNPKRLSIDQAATALKQMGVTLGPGRFDLHTKQTIYHVKRGDKKAEPVDVDKLRKIVYRSARNPAQ